MTTAIDTDAALAEADLADDRAEWLTALHDIFEFFSENPSMIDGMTVTVTGWPEHRKETVREQVVRFSDLVGPCTVDAGSDRSYARVMSAMFAPHYLSLYASREAVGHKVRDAVPEEWEWDALGEQS